MKILSLVTYSYSDLNHYDFLSSVKHTKNILKNTGIETTPNMIDCDDAFPLGLGKKIDFSISIDSYFYKMILIHKA